MKIITFIFLILFTAFNMDSFRSQQKKYPRVRNAYKEKLETVKKHLADKEIETLNIDIFLRAFKHERKLEVWAKSNLEDEFAKITEYKICGFSGSLGPKRKQGDYQIPEGFYHIDRFNPSSNFYLSLGINYPNSSDRILGNRSNLGGDIFIHGSCCTIGCIPITDDKIMELYIMAVEAKNAGLDRIPVHIFPAKLDDELMNTLKSKYSEDNKLLKFWENLKTGYDFFEEHRSLPKVSSDSKGKYFFK